MTLLSARNLDLRIGRIDILRDIDFTVGTGEMIGLIGPNGAGKSSLLRLLAGVAAADGGRVDLLGRPLAEVPAGERARAIGYLVQDARAQWPFSVEKVVGLGRLPYQRWWQGITAADAELVERAMRRTETIAYRNRIVTTLSGGEQTLVMLARIFATEPRLLLADEPVAALDPYHQIHVMELLREAAADGAVVVVLHDLNLAARFCDRLYLMHHGRVQVAGAVDEVLTADNLRLVYGIDCRIEQTAGACRVVDVRRRAQTHP